MKPISTVIIGAGHSGLAMSSELARRDVDHVVLERGQVANSWRTERWDSLRLLSPNWMNGLPGAPYRGTDPDGYMDVPELVAAFDAFARSGGAPIRSETEVMSVTREAGRYRVQTDQGALWADSVVVATGACAIPKPPACAAGMPARIAGFTPLNYKRPSQLPPGDVLVVGASASGLQIARELVLDGRGVTLAVGNHLRMPRIYRGADILRWMEVTGLMDVSHTEVDDIERVRRTPSLPLMGSDTRETLDLNALQALGVRIAGRLAGIAGRTAQFSGSLANLCASADLKLNRMLAAIDEWIGEADLDPLLPGPERFAPTRLPVRPCLALDLDTIGSVVWATGFRPDHRWLNLPVFDRKGRLGHDGGVVGDGLYAMGLPYLRTRQSTHIAGAGADARALADHLTTRLAHSRAA